MAEAIEVQIGKDAIAIVTWRFGLLNPGTIARFGEIVDRLVTDDKIQGAIVTGAPALDLEWLLEATAPGNSEAQ